MAMQQKTISQWIAAAAVLPLTVCMVGQVYGQTGTDAPVPRDPGVVTPGKSGGELKPRRDRDATGGVVKRERGATGTGDSATSKAKRGAKRSLERARRGVSGVDS